MPKRSRQELQNYAHFLRQMPYQIYDTMEQVRDGQVEIGFRHEGVDPFLHRMDVVANRFVIAIVAGSGAIGSALIGTFAHSGPQVFGLNVVSIAGFSISGLLGLWLVWSVVRSGRL